MGLWLRMVAFLDFSLWTNAFPSLAGPCQSLSPGFYFLAKEESKQVINGHIRRLPLSAKDAKIRLYPAY